jgi:hypothetical protein
MLRAVVFSVSALIPPVWTSSSLQVLGVADSFGRIRALRALAFRCGLSRGSSTDCCLSFGALVVAVFGLASTAVGVLGLCRVSICLDLRNRLRAGVTRSLLRALHPCWRHCNIVGRAGRHGSRMLLCKLICFARDACLRVVRLTREAVFLV